MSIAVPLADLEAKLAEYPWCYLVTVSDDQRAHLLAVPTQFVDGVFAAVSRSWHALERHDRRPEVTLVFPPASGTEMSLIVDGHARVFDEHVEVTPTNAVLHRPAL